MRCARLLLCTFVAASRAALALQAADPAMLRYIDSNSKTGSSAAVVVPDVPLVYTTQLLPVDAAGRVVHAGDAAEQLAALWQRLEVALKDFPGREGEAPAEPPTTQKSEAQQDLRPPQGIVKLHFYLAREDLVEVVQKDLVARFNTEQRPAVSFVITPLPLADTLLALDAVAASGVEVDGARRSTKAAVMPAGCRLYVSGQAEKGQTLAEATRKTLASLSATLKHCGRTDRDVVQLKCFLNPMKSVAEAQQEIERHFAPNQLPPVTYVEWRSAAPSIEIELVAWGGPAVAANGALEFITPPGMTSSPLFSRVAKIHRGGSIFIGDLFRPGNSPAAEQAKAPFEQLKLLLEQTGSDFKHLAKATYYVTDDEVGKAHNAIRPTYYDPARPPAASKALVGSTGRAGVRYVMDMLAVPSR